MEGLIYDSWANLRRNSAESSANIYFGVNHMGNKNMGHIFFSTCLDPELQNWLCCGKDIL